MWNLIAAGLLSAAAARLVVKASPPRTTFKTWPQDGELQPVQDGPSSGGLYTFKIKHPYLHDASSAPANREPIGLAERRKLRMAWSGSGESTKAMVRSLIFAFHEQHYARMSHVVGALRVGWRESA